MKSYKLASKTPLLSQKSLVNWLFKGLKMIISLGVVLYASWEFYNRSDAIIEALRVFKNSMTTVLLVFLLMPVNWMLESLKWKEVTKPVYDLSISNALKSILAGMSLSFVTPFALGDYFARILSFPVANRDKLFGNIILVRFTQLLPTLLFGTIAIIYLSVQTNYDFTSKLFIFLIGAGIFFFLVVWIALKHSNKRFLKLIQRYLEWVDLLKKNDIVYILTLSFIRYGVFSLQFVLLLSVFNAPLSIIKLFLGAAFMFFAKSIVPTIHLFSDLGVRELSVMLFFQAFTSDLSPAIASSLVLWVINILIPSIVGTPFIKDLKLSAT